MSLTFPTSPSVGDTYTVGARTWSWSGTIWEMTGTVAVAGSIGTSELAASAVTAAKIASSAVTEAKIGSGAVTQAKLTSGLSGITVTTTSLRSSVIPSPFTGQFAFMTDTNAFIRWDGSAWVAAIVTAPTEAPTSLALVSATMSTATISFAAGADGGSAITNYQYALSTNSGSSYGSYNALATPDGTTPITITGLTAGTAYYIKLKAVNAQGVSAIESNALSFSTTPLTVDYLVVAGGGGGGRTYAGGGGAGGFRTATGFAVSAGSALTVTVGAGGNGVTGGTGQAGNNGSDSVFSTITSTGGGGAGAYNAQAARSGGSGGGGGADIEGGRVFGNGTAGQGNNGGPGSNDGNYKGGGGGGAGAAGSDGNATGNGGAGTANSYSGSAVTYAGGGGGGKFYNAGSAGAGGSGGGGAGGYGGANGTAGTANTGGGGGGAGGVGAGVGAGPDGAAGGSGVVILRYPEGYTITIGAGLTGTESAASGGYKRTTITAGTGNVSWA